MTNLNFRAAALILALAASLSSHPKFVLHSSAKEEKTSETGVGEALTGPRLFSELGTALTTREVVIPTGSRTERRKLEERSPKAGS